MIIYLIFMIIFTTIVLIGLIITSVLVPLNRKNQKKYEEIKKNIKQKSIYQKIQDLNEKVVPIGFAYEPQQDIFYSIMNGWQKEFGYCRLYDEAAAPLYIIIDSEPIYFNYNGKKWLIEFWKGQYGMTTGAELGIYVSEDIDLNIKEGFNGTFYHSVEEEDFLPISISLWKNDSLVFTRKGWHWWLTGFVVGEFSTPSELTLEIEIIFEDIEMQTAFVDGLKNTGYTDDKVKVINNKVKIIFDKPYTSQPFTQKSFIASIYQKCNENHCKLYRELTKDFDNSMDQLIFLQERAPKLFDKAVSIGKTQKLYKDFNKIQNI
jgi:hypothetical protein